MKGNRLEWMVKRRLEGLGYLVIRAAASHGPFDLVAFRSKGSETRDDGEMRQRDFEVRCIEVKGNHKPSKSQLSAMLKAPVPVEIWVHRDRSPVWDVYEPTPTGLELVRREAYG